jgi:hypothetical protein
MESPKTKGQNENNKEKGENQSNKASTELLVTETPLERPLCIDPKSLIKDNQTTYRN